jgi:hypothetical protein
MNGSISLASDVYLGRAIHRIQRASSRLSLTNDLNQPMNSDSQEPRPLELPQSTTTRWTRATTRWKFLHSNLGLSLAIRYWHWKCQAPNGTAATWRRDPLVFVAGNAARYWYLTILDDAVETCETKDLDRAHTGQQSILSNLKFLCEMLDGTLLPPPSSKATPVLLI